MPDINPATTMHNRPLEEVLEGVLADMTTMRTAMNTLVTKLNSDGGVSDTNYAAITTLTTTNT